MKVIESAIEDIVFSFPLPEHSAKWSSSAKTNMIWLSSRNLIAFRAIERRIDRCCFAKSISACFLLTNVQGISVRRRRNSCLRRRARACVQFDVNADRSMQLSNLHASSLHRTSVWTDVCIWQSSKNNNITMQCLDANDETQVFLSFSVDYPISSDRSERVMLVVLCPQPLLFVVKRCVSRNWEGQIFFVSIKTQIQWICLSMRMSLALRQWW